MYDRHIMSIGLVFVFVSAESLTRLYTRYPDFVNISDYKRSLQHCTKGSDRIYKKECRVDERFREELEIQGKTFKEPIRNWLPKMNNFKTIQKVKL